MHTISIVLPIALLLGCLVAPAEAKTVTVAQDGSGDFNGDTDVAIRKALQAAGGWRHGPGRGEHLYYLAHTTLG